MLWEVKAEYADGSTFERYFQYEEESYQPDCEIQYNLERLAIERRDDCIWYSVNVVGE